MFSLQMGLRLALQRQSKRKKAEEIIFENNSPNLMNNVTTRSPATPVFH